MVASQSNARVTHGPGVANDALLLVREHVQRDPPKPRLLDRVRVALRARHGSRRTEKAYVAWIRRYILFHGRRHPAAMGATEVTQFLTALAVERNVAASTQNQALSALLSLYRHAGPVRSRPALPGLGGAMSLQMCADGHAFGTAQFEFAASAGG